MGTVYVPQESMRRVGEYQNGTPRFVPAVDLAPAAAYGRLVVLLPNGISSINGGSIMREMRRHLLDFCDDDFIVATGEPAALAAAVLLASDYNEGRVQVLRWDKEARAYVVLAFDLEERSADEGR